LCAPNANSFVCRNSSNLQANQSDHCLKGVSVAKAFSFDLILKSVFAVVLRIYLPHLPELTNTFAKKAKGDRGR
jgi:hypothetical protein